MSAAIQPASDMSGRTSPQEFGALMQSVKGIKEGWAEIRKGMDGPGSLHWNRHYFQIVHPTGQLVYKDGDSQIVMARLRDMPIRTVDYPDRGIAIELGHKQSALYFQADSDAQLREWFAAFLCWQSIHPTPLLKKPSDPSLAPSPPPSSTRKRFKLPPLRRSSVGGNYDSSIVMSGRLHLKVQSKLSLPRPALERASWRKINLTLRDDGWLNIADNDTPVESIFIPDLSRHSIFAMDSSVLSKSNCFTITPNSSTPKMSTKTANMAFNPVDVFSGQTAAAKSVKKFTSPKTKVHSANTPLHQPISSPVVLYTQSQTELHAWIVMLRSFALPEIVGCPLIDQDMYTVDRSLHVRVLDARYLETIMANSSPATSKTMPGAWVDDRSPGVDTASTMTPRDDFDGEKNFGSSLETYCEILVENETKGKTSTQRGNAPFWTEDFHMPFLSHLKSGLTVQVIDHRRLTKDVILGHVDIPLLSLRRSDVHDGWFPILQPVAAQETSGDLGVLDPASQLAAAFAVGHVPMTPTPSGVSAITPAARRTAENDVHIGDVRLRVRYDELVVLPLDDYQAVRELVTDAEKGPELSVALSLAASGKQTSDDTSPMPGGVKPGSQDYLERIADNFVRIFQGEENVAGEETPRLRLVDWISVLIKQEVQQVERTDANILFRGNTLLTKALDRYMRLIGQDYLEHMLGSLVATVHEEKVCCEVDPTKLDKGEDSKSQWKLLKYWTATFWRQIETNKESCPNELRKIFGYIRNCVVQRYGWDGAQSARYTCVSGFIFLRFLCPAVLNPKLFGLTKEFPDPRIQRTLTLITKSLQGLANLTRFGIKEPWMEPMNEFINQHSESFKRYIDYISTPAEVPNAKGATSTSAADSMAYAVRERLPPAYQESLATLPCLIDLSREYALLSATVMNASPALSADGSEHVVKLVEASQDVEKLVRERVKRSDIGLDDENAVEILRQRLFDTENEVSGLRKTISARG